MRTRPYQETDEPALIEFWQFCGLVVPSNDPRKDIIRKVQDSPELFLVSEVEGELVVSSMAGYEGHRG
jgi:hypothetical protein